LPWIIKVGPFKDIVIGAVAVYCHTDLHGRKKYFYIVSKNEQKSG
jgi:hypothetical protein